jgi:hypothetical protein
MSNSEYARHFAVTFGAARQRLTLLNRQGGSPESEQLVESHSAR